MYYIAYLYPVVTTVLVTLILWILQHSLIVFTSSYLQLALCTISCL